MLNRVACETSRKRAGLACVVALAAVAALAWSVPVGAQAAHETPAQAAPAAADHGAVPTPAGEHGAAAGHAPAESHDASPWPFVGKIVNFLILAGAIVYLARQPFATYLADRGVQIKDDLVRAAEMKDEAGRQIADIEAKLLRLPGELDALRARGKDDVAAEESRINEVAALERERLLEQTRREIDLQLRVARRDLVTHAADLAVQVARDRIRDRITTDDQRRLVERYLSQVKSND